MAQDFVVKILFIEKSCAFCLTANKECCIVIAHYGDCRIGGAPSETVGAE